LTPSASLQGRGVWDDSRPAVGATVIVVSKSDRGTDAGAASKVCSYLSTTYPETITDNSGTFGVSGLFEGTRVDVVAAPEGACQGCSVIEEGVLAGTSDLTIVLSKQRVEGVTLRGRVTSRDAANPITTLLVTVLHRRASGRSWESSVIRTLNVPDGRFELEHLRLGDTYGFRFEAEGHAPVVVEAWEARPDAEEMHADLSQHGSAKVCLERESNDDIRQLGVTLVRIDALTALRPWRWSQLLAPRTDCAEFPILRDGRYRVMVGRPSDSAPLVDDEIEVALDAETSKTFVVPKPPR
jgi:Fe-S cluster biogenesis protein NfuA